MLEKYQKQFIRLIFWAYWSHLKHFQFVLMRFQCVCTHKRYLCILHMSDYSSDILNNSQNYSSNFVDNSEDILPKKIQRQTVIQMIIIIQSMPYLFSFHFCQSLGTISFLFPTIFSFFCLEYSFLSPDIMWWIISSNLCINILNK